MTMDHSDFLEAILAAPEDDAPRLVYADWLLERDDSRGEFIRIQCELQAIADGDSKVARRLKIRENALLRENREKWAPGLDKQVAKYEFRRGFVEFVHVHSTLFASEAKLAALFHVAPALSALEIDYYGDSLNNLVASPYTARLRSLQLNNNEYNKGFSDAHASLCADSPHFRGLTHLHVTRGKLTDKGALRLAKSTNLSQLRELHVWSNELGAEGIVGLLESPQFQLQKLYCGQNNLGVDGAKALAASPRAAHLTALDVSENNLGAPGLEILAGSPHLTGLTELLIRKSKLGWKGAEVLARTANFNSVESLDVMGNALGVKGATALAESPNLTGVTELSLWQTSMGDEGVTILAGSPLFGRLRSLNLRSNRLTDAAALAIAASPHAASLKSINLNNNRIGRKGAKALDTSKYLEKTRVYFERRSG